MPDPADAMPGVYRMTPEDILNQDLAEYDAVTRNQPNFVDVWGKPRLTPEQYDRIYVAPVRAKLGFASPPPSSKWSGPIETAGGTVLTLDEISGQPRILVQGGQTPPKAVSPPGQAQADLRALKAMLAAAKTDAERADLQSQISAQQSYIDALVAAEKAKGVKPSTEVTTENFAPSGKSVGYSVRRTGPPVVTDNSLPNFLNDLRAIHPAGQPAAVLPPPPAPSPAVSPTSARLAPADYWNQWTNRAAMPIQTPGTLALPSPTAPDERSPGGELPVQPLPRSKAELQRGVRYVTARGIATWDGTRFVK